MGGTRSIRNKARKEGVMLPYTCMDDDIFFLFFFFLKKIILKIRRGIRYELCLHR